MTRETFALLYGLDLRDLTLDNVSVDAGERGFDFRGRWPRLARLALLGQAVAPRHLLQFALLEQLEFLSVSLIRPAAEDADFLPDCVFCHVRANTSKTLTLRSGVPGFGRIQRPVLERYASRLWPGLIVQMRRANDRREVRGPRRQYEDNEDVERSDSEGDSWDDTEDVKAPWVKQLALYTNRL
ncbi:hypothetical protein FS749_000541 [Ceratobasidium sp. UAMH 11750]|nr:hypothetical protein FS749_000541 [Ceratobasidium sp. UAMH 11750]